MNKLYDLWRLFQDNFLQYLSAILLLSLTLLAILEVVRRYVLGVSFEWQQDLVTFGILSGIFLFFGITQARRAHLRVSALLLLLRERVEKLEDWLRALLKYSDRFSLFGYVLILYGQAASI